MYFPNMLKEVRETTARVELADKAMTDFFYVGIILITLFSAINFLGIDVVSVIRHLF